ncbi:MAG: hypothetical protein Q4E37_05905 [Tissierellia bacterium]|nr:hypothetical protein [Tissierellia bacterium]
MDATITLKDLLLILLYIAGIGALVYLALTLKNVFQLIKSINGKLKEHEVVIDDTLRKIPSLTDDATIIASNASKLTTDATELVEVVKPEVEKVAITVGNASATVDDVVRTVDETSNKLSQTVNTVSDSLNYTAKTISLNTDNIFDYFYILREVLLAMGEFIKRKA